MIEWLIQPTPLYVFLIFFIVDAIWKVIKDKDVKSLLEEKRKL